MKDQLIYLSSVISDDLRDSIIFRLGNVPWDTINLNLVYKLKFFLYIKKTLGYDIR